MDVLTDTRRILLRIQAIAAQRRNAGASLNHLLLLIEGMAHDQALLITQFQLMQKADTNDTDPDGRS